MNNDKTWDLARQVIELQGRLLDQNYEMSDLRVQVSDQQLQITELENRLTSVITQANAAFYAIRQEINDLANPQSSVSVH